MQTEDPSNPSLPNPAVMKASEQRFSAMVMATSDVVYSLSADWTVMQGIDGRGFLLDAKGPTTDWRTIYIYQEDLDKVNDAIAKAISTKSIFELEHRVRLANGTIGWTMSRAIPILNDEGEILEWFGTAKDITDNKTAEEKIAQTIEQANKLTRLYEAVTSATPDLIYVFDLDYKFTYANKALLDMWGKSWDNAIGKGLLENGYETWHAEMHHREIDQVVATGMPIRGEVSFPHATLGRRVYDYIFTPIFDPNGKVEAVSGTTRDVTDRKQFEEALENSSSLLQSVNEEMAATNEELAASNEELIATNEQLVILNEQLRQARQKIEEGEIALRQAIDAANFGTWFIHSKTREFLTDARSKELHGFYADDEFTIEQAIAQITEDYRSDVAEKLDNAIYNDGDYDVTYPVIGFHDKKLRWLRAIGNLKADPSGNFSAFTGVLMDITDQYLNAKKIQQAEENLRMAVESGELGTWQLDEKLGNFESSPRLNELFGLSPRQELSYDTAINQIHLPYRQLVNEAIKNTFSGEKPLNVEFPITGLLNGKQRWVRSVGKLMADGKTANYITGIMADITEQKNDELRKNDFIAMVSHELKTPLTSMKGYIQVTLRKLNIGADEFTSGALQKASVQVEKMTQMIDGFLNLSRLESGKINIKPELFDLATLIKEAEDEAFTTISSHEIIFEPLDSTLITADRDKIGQVIHNLISNAVKYSPEGSLIQVACKNDGQNVNLSVTDQGIGINELDLPKIFDRYYRAEHNNMSAISGFGIGLYICKEIITRHQGRIWAESSAGQGSVFTFSLPLSLTNGTRNQQFSESD